MLFLNEFRNQTEIKNAINIPINGANTMKLAVLSTRLCSIAPNPPCAIAAPANPPINVCEEEDGIPFHQVIKFQVIAPINPEIITGSVTNSLCTVFATVFATPWSLNIKNATKLKKAAHKTA